MEPAHKTLAGEPDGVSKEKQGLYRECMKNHAASLGGHALDGCGEFMASPTSKPSDPTSLTCAACGCHRNFHRRLPLLRPESGKQANDDYEEEGEEEEEEIQEDEEEERVDNSSAPRMLLALSGAGGISPKPQAEPARGEENGGDPLSWQKQATPNPSSRKRFRTKFSAQQKEKMHELSEAMGWKMSKRDEALMENRCREIGIGKRVFKVWMHNNKHNFVQSSSSSLRSNTVPAITATTVAAPVTNGNGMIVKINGSASDAAEDN